MKEDRKTLLSNSAWSLFNQLARIGALAILLITLSRHFGPARFGALIFGLAFVRIFAVVAAFGLDRPVVGQLVESPNESNSILRAAFRLKLIVGSISYLCLLGLVAALSFPDHLTLGIVALAGPSLLFQAGDVFDFAFQAQHRFRLVFLGRTLPLLLATAIKLMAVVAGAPLLLFAGLETFEAALIATALFFIYRATKKSAKPVGAVSLNARGLLNRGLPLLLGSLAVMIYMRSDILLLGKMVGYQAAGIYSAAAQITEGCALFPMAFAPALFPLLLSWRRRGPQFYQQQFEKLFSLAFLAGLGVALCLTIIAPGLIRLCYGQAYAPAAAILAIHAWTAVFIYLAIMQSGYDVTEGLTWIAACRTAAGATLNVGLNLTLIPHYGAIGSAIATLCSQFCSSFLFNLCHPRTRPLFWWQLRAAVMLPLVKARVKPPIREASPDNQQPLPV